MFSRHVCVIGAILMAGCSTTPRTFSPVLADATPPDAVFEAALVRCTELVNAGVRSDFRDSSVAAGGVGAAAGVGAGAIVFAEALSSGAAAGAVSTATVVAIPVVGILSVGLYARSRRAKREADVQSAISRCLAEDGYFVDSWRLER